MSNPWKKLLRRNFGFKLIKHLLCTIPLLLTPQSAGRLLSPTLSDWTRAPATWTWAKTSHPIACPPACTQFLPKFKLKHKLIWPLPSRRISPEPGRKKASKIQEVQVLLSIHLWIRVLSPYYSVLSMLQIWKVQLKISLKPRQSDPLLPKHALFDINSSCITVF